MTGRKADDYWYDAGEYGCEKSKELCEQLSAVLTKQRREQLQLELAEVEKARAKCYRRRAAKWEREQDEAYAQQWVDETYGPDVPGVLL